MSPYLRFPSHQKNFFRFFRALLVLILIALGAGALFIGSRYVTNNFAAVVPHELYRSAQLSASGIEFYQKKYGIKTIINLRGDNTGSPWYDDEVAEAKRLGIAHVNFRMSGRRDLPQDRARHLIDLMNKAEKPALLHCFSGADRTGLAAALYLAAVKGRSLTEAEGQLSILYGHIPSPLFKEYQMDLTFKSLTPFLEEMRPTPEPTK